MMINRFKNIYDRLSDEYSRYIFEKRLMCSVTGDKSYAVSLGREYENTVLNSRQWREFHEKLKLCGERIILYSAGYWGRELLSHTKDIPWRYVVDRHSDLEEFCGVKLLNIDDYISKEEDCYIVVASRVYFEEIREELIQRGIQPDRIMDGAILYDLSEGKQYFDLMELPHSGGMEVFADVGCYDGLSTVFFNEWCKGNGFSYCFEPDKTNIERIHRVLRNKNIDAYELIDKGVWNAEGSLSFVSTGNSVSHISDDSTDSESIKVVALDDVLFDKGVTFIKMDIEGAEFEALKGAGRIIRDQKPKLAICVYHKPQDIWELPKLILEFNDTYKFYLRHYSYKDNETVLYAF